MKVAQSCPTLCDPMDYTYRPWNSPGQNTEVGSLSLLQGIFPTHGSNQDLLHCRWFLYQLSYEGSPENRVIYSLAPGIMFFLSVCPKLFKSQGGCCPFGVPGGLCRVWVGGCSQCAGSPVSVCSHFCPLSSAGHSLQNPRGSQGECIH